MKLPRGLLQSKPIYPCHLVCHDLICGSDVATAKQRYDRYNEKATDHLAKKNEERAVLIAKSITSLMQAQSKYHKALAEALPQGYDQVTSLIVQLSDLTV